MGALEFVREVGEKVDRGRRVLLAVAAIEERDRIARPFYADFLDGHAAIVLHRLDVDHACRLCWPRLAPAALSAAATVLARSIVTVMGPTPPGTGVIQPATCDADA